jgi:hypothetical protein
MSIVSPPCGPHCGRTSTREGHCDCDLCHDGHAGGKAWSSVIIVPGSRPHSESDQNLPRKTSMCDRWYTRAGDYRPWDVHVEGCRCAIPAACLESAHGKHCPVRQHYDRELLLTRLTGEPGGAETWPP